MNKIKIINLEIGLPFVSEALSRLDFALYSMKRDNVKHAIIIHGYGKRTQGGGKIKEAARELLKQKLKNGELKKVVFGENLTIFDSFGSQLAASYDNVREYLSGRNIGITAIEI